MTKGARSALKLQSSELVIALAALAGSTPKRNQTQSLLQERFSVLNATSVMDISAWRA